MRLLVGLGLLILLFAALARIVPPALTLPLYLFFVIVTIAFTGWERRRITERRRRLEGQLRHHETESGQTQKEVLGDDKGS